MRSTWTPALALASFGLVACGQSSPAPIAVVDLSPTAAASAAPSATLEVPATAFVKPREHPGARNSLARLIDVEVPKELACGFGADVIRFEDGLALTANGKPFVEVTSRDALVARLGVGARAFVVDLEIGGVFLRGFARAEAVSLYPQRALVFAEFVAPEPHVALDVVPTGKDAITLSLGAFGRELGAKPTRPSRCADVGLAIQSFDPRGVFPEATEAGVLVGDEIPLALAADDGWTFRLAPREDDPRAIDVIEVRGERARIVWPTEGFVASGWIPRANLRLESPPGSFGAIGSLGLDGTGAGGIPQVHVCPMDMSLSAEVDGVQRVVGYVRRETPMFEAGATRGALIAVNFVDHDLRPVEGALLLVEAAALARCPVR